MDEKLTIFLASWGRPIYLWTCLDALWRYSRSPFQIILLNNLHPDRLQNVLLEDVISSFYARKMFAEIVMFKDNSFENIRQGYRSRLDKVGARHVFMESDAVICDRSSCWIETMQQIMVKNPFIGMLGSMIDVRDFVPADNAFVLTNNDHKAARFLAKLNSPERGFIHEPAWSDSSNEFFITEPPCPIRNPPGRLMMLDTETMLDLGLHTDGALANQFRLRGMTPSITPLVKHRHLSLLNIYDYKDYCPKSRNAFFSV